MYKFHAIPVKIQKLICVLEKLSISLVKIKQNEIKCYLYSLILIIHLNAKKIEM